MRGDKARHLAIGIDIPRGADVQGCVVRRKQRAIDRVTSVVPGFFGSDHRIFPNVLQQLPGNPFDARHMIEMTIPAENG